MKRSRISDYSKKRAPIRNEHEETSNPRGISLPTMLAYPVACKKTRTAKSLDFQREKSVRRLRPNLPREKNVSRGLGLGIHRQSSVKQGLGLRPGIHRQSSVTRGLGFSNRTARGLEAKKEEIQFEFPKRPRTKRQRQRDDDGAPLCWSDLKVVYDDTTQKHNLVSDDMTLSPIKTTPPMTCQGSPSLDVKDESFRTASSPFSVIDDLCIHSTPMNAQVTMSPEEGDSGGAHEIILEDFTEPIATTGIDRPIGAVIINADFLEVSSNEFSPHLVHCFQNTMDQIVGIGEEILKERVAEAYLANWMESLTCKVLSYRGIFGYRKDSPVF
jgi:hypothetical protein